MKMQIGPMQMGRMAEVDSGARMEKHAREIPVEMENVKKAVADLRSAVSRLLSLIEPVMVPEPPSDPKTCPPEPARFTDLGTCLSQISASIHSTREWVASACDRCQL